MSKIRLDATEGKTCIVSTVKNNISHSLLKLKSSNWILLSSYWAIFHNEVTFSNTCCIIREGLLLKEWFPI